jgi:biopolymer transport protein ExbD
VARKKIEENTPGEPPMTPMIDVIFQLLIFFMVTLKFSTQEGKILSQLPKDKGLGPSDVTNPEINEVKIIFCADGSETGLKKHFENKGAHDHESNKNLSRQRTTLMVERQSIGVVTLSAVGKSSDPAKIRENQKFYDMTAEQAARLYESLSSSSDPTKKAPVKIDPDSEVPFEHVLGVVNALKKRKVDNLEYEGNPRLTRYFGDELKKAQTGQ